MRRKSFLDGENILKCQLRADQVRATPTDTWKSIDFGKKEIFTLTEEAAAISRLKSEKDAEENEI